MKKILLIQPNMRVATSGQRIVYPPIGIMYLAAVLEKKGYNVQILDCQTEGLDKDAEVIDGYVEVGIPLAEIREKIAAFGPDLVGITCNFSVMVPHMNETARLVKEMSPAVPVVAGGNHPTSLPEEVMENGAIDYIIMGEGEISFPMLLESIQAGRPPENVPGLVWRKEGALVKNAMGSFIHDLDSLPYPAWHLFPYEKYSRHYQPRTVTWGEPQAMPSVMTTRGCAGGCVFCSVHKTMGRKFRARKLDEVFKEIRFLVDTYKIKKLMIIDDNFTHNKNRAKEFCDEFKKQGLDIELHFMVLALWCMDEELIDKLKSIGCTSMGFAIESGVQEILTNVVKKPLKLPRAMELLRYARSKGIHLTGTFVIGFPGETKKDIRRSLYMANYSGLFDSREIYIATPLPGSELFEKCRKEGLLADGFSYSKVEVVKPNIRTKDFSPGFILTILEADRTHHLIKANPKRLVRCVRDVWKRKRDYFFQVLFETFKMFVKYDFLKIREQYP
ncbi:MAG: B12-binding domain-containing radical SAM protein [Deltaproteobacteria bacterium]|nr:B12-binding domain-containing radical SAM protein [Deltaproteobacteria bacterium]